MKRRDSDLLELLLDDPDVAAVNKPAGLAAIPGRAESDSLLERLARQLGLPHADADDPRLRVVHRLDKDTSGVMLFAKHVEAQRALSHQFQNNAAAKEYVALVAGKPADDEGEIDAPIGVHATDKKRMAVLKRGGRPARTAWRVEARFRTATLLRVFPKTGKTHQIRVHLAHLGLPLLIDPLYNPAGTAELRLSAFKRGYRPGGSPERPLIDRLTLHAERLTLSHPNGASLDLTAPLPKDFRAAIQALTKYG